MKPRAAFTLFQLLVVLALLALLLGLFLPLVAKARQAANRSQSANNLMQLAVAVHNFHGAEGQLCPGLDQNHFSTTAYLLPYIEQDNLFRQVDFKKSIDDKANAAARRTTLQILLNPQDLVQSVNKEYGATNYLWNAGSNFALKDNNGLFYLDSKIKFRDVTDGLSNTVMAGETLKGDGNPKAVDVRRQHVQYKVDVVKNLKDDSGVQDFKDDKNIAADRCASWMDGRFLQGTFTGTRRINDERPDVTCAGQGGLSGLRSMNGGANIAFADGSVRYVNDKVKVEIWKWLTDRQDGNALPEF